MNKYEIAGLAGAIAQVSNNGLEPKKGLKLYRFYQELKGIQTEVQEYQKKLMEDFGKQYGMDVDQVKEMAGSDTENYFREDAQTKKAIDWLYEKGDNRIYHLDFINEKVDVQIYKNSK